MWSTLLALVPSLIGLLGGGNSSQANQTPGATNEDMTAILSNQRRRMESQDPLFDAVNRMAMGLLPTQYQSQMSGMAGRSGPTPNPRQPTERSQLYPNAPNFGAQTPWATPETLRSWRGNRANPEG